MVAQVTHVKALYDYVPDSAADYLPLKTGMFFINSLS